MIPRGSDSFPRIHRAAGPLWLVSVLVVGVAISCGGGPSPERETSDEGIPSFELHDSAGVNIATARLATDTPHWWIEPEPELTLGEIDGEFPYLFQRPEFAATLSDGRVVVANFGSGELRWFDAGGRFLESFGRKGEGPWEFGEFNRVVRLPGDTLVIYDRVNLRLTRVGPDGAPLAELSFREVTAARRAAGWSLLDRPESKIVGSGGSTHLALWRYLLFAGPLAGGGHAIGFRSANVASSLPPHPQVDTTRAQVVVVRMDEEGEQAVLAELPGTLQVYLWVDQPPPRGTVGAPFEIPFATRPLMASRGETLVVSETGSYRIRVYDGAGDLVRIIQRGDIAPRRVTRDLIDEYVARTVGRPGSMVESMVREVANTSFALVGQGYHLPTHAELYLDAADRIWVEDWRFPWDEGEPRTFTVFDVEGRILASATVPSHLEITDIGLDHLTGVVWDEMGVEFVQIYSIRR